MPKSVKGKRGLARYYRKFITNYEAIAAPLTDLLKKYSYQWDQQALDSFNNLKQALTAPPVLPNFNDSFAVECDASGVGLVAVLMQREHLIVFFSKVLHGRKVLLSTYERDAGIGPHGAEM